MKRKNCFVILGTFALVLSMNLSGCGNQGDVPAHTPTAKAEHSENSKLNGYVKQIDSGSFVVNKNIITSSDGLTDDVSVTSDINVTVTYTDTTKFIMRTFVNGGVNPEDSSDAPASADDLRKDSMVDLKGSGDDTEFAASEVVMYTFK